MAKNLLLGGCIAKKSEAILGVVDVRVGLRGVDGGLTRVELRNDWETMSSGRW